MLVNAALSAVIVGLVAGVSVIRQPAAPPTISEFAPANPGRVTAEPSDQAARPGESPRHSGPLLRPQGKAGVPSALQCWSWPDGSTTQTFDRQSPPCIASWDVETGNGGATTVGVSRGEIRIGVPAESVSAWQPFAAFVSSHYQLYGRRLTLVALGVHDLTAAESQRAAGSAAAERRLFAALDDPGAGAATPDLGVYLDTLAAKRVIGVLTSDAQLSTTALAAQAPFAWSRQPAMDTVQAVLATTVCRELTGHRARFSRQTSGQDRRFAVLVPASKANGGTAFDTDALQSGLDRCHVAARVIEYDPAAPDRIEATVAQAKRDGVTTFIPFGSARTLADAVMPAALRVGSRPEWLLPGLASQRSTQAWAQAPAAEREGLFGLATWAVGLSSGRLPAVQALNEVAPRATLDASGQAVYDGLTLLAAGIQLAGPHLTAESFAHGLETTAFANPGAGQAPDHQARVGFTDRDHAMLDDVAKVWWHDDSFCFVGGGRRWALDELDYADPGFFDLGKGC